MTDHRLIVARGFRIAGLVVGLPSTAAAIGFGVGAFVAKSGAPAHRSDYLDVGTYGIVGLISNAATGVGGVLSVFNGIAAWVFGLFAVLALAAALFAGLLYIVGRGLKASAIWARVLAILMMGLVALNSLLAFLVMRGGARLLDALLLAAAGYALWALVWRFKAGRPLDQGPAAPIIS